MANVNFIELFKSKEEALSSRTSPLIQFHRNNGIQLIPNNEFPYIQSTNEPNGIELEDWAVNIVSLCGSRKEDVTSNFLVERVYFDDNGQAQFEWSLTNVPFDFGSKLVYLEIEQLVGEKFYSNVFQLTSRGVEKTTRIDYKNKESDSMHSMSLQMYFWQNLKTQEVTTYYETSTRNTVTALVKSQKHERWQTKVVPNDFWIKVTDAFENKFVYINLVRSYLFDGMEVQEFEGGENFKQNTFKLSFNHGDVYDPLYSPPIIVNYPSIILESVTTNGYTANYVFSLSNFSPSYLIYEFSDDMTTWNSVALGSTSPQNRAFNGTDTWYFRIKHPEAISNIITLNLGNTVVANNDNVQVGKGEIMDISVLTNDVLVGATTITAVTVPTNGTATIINSGTAISYVHDGSLTGFDTFDYTISNGATSDTATVSVVITNSGEDSVPLSMSDNGDRYNPDACLLSLDATRYYASGAATLAVNDFVYTDASLFNAFNGRNLYYAFKGGKVAKINTEGRVTDILIC